MLRTTIDPIPIPGFGWALPLPNGVTLWCADPLPEHATDDMIAHHRAIVAAFDLLGHKLIVGGYGALAVAAVEEMGDDD